LVSLTPSLERLLGDALQQTDEGSYLAIEPSTAQVVINKLARAAEKFGEIGQTPVLLAPGHLRPAVFNFVERFAPGYAVLSHHEIAANTKVQSLGVLSIGE
jgi:flagellar biosynthesis protein FlhA